MNIAKVSKAKPSHGFWSRFFFGWYWNSQHTRLRSWDRIKRVYSLIVDDTVVQTWNYYPSDAMVDIVEDTYLNNL